MHADDIIRKWHPTQSPWLQYMYIQLTVCTLLVQPHFGHLSCMLVVCMIHHKIERMLPNRWTRSVVTFMKTNKSASWYIVLVLLSFCTSGLEGLPCRGIGKTCEVCRFFDLTYPAEFLGCMLVQKCQECSQIPGKPPWALAAQTPMVQLSPCKGPPRMRSLRMLPEGTKSICIVTSSVLRRCQPDSRESCFVLSLPTFRSVQSSLAA